MVLVGVALLGSATAATLRADEPPEYTLTTWTARDGLPSSYLLSLAEDGDGFLWIGTTAGLVRFDGQSFATWPRSGEFPSPNPLVYAICPARDGALWLAGASGLIREHHGEARVFTYAQGVPQTTRSIIESHDGTIWAGGTGGLARFRDDRWQTVEIPATARAGIDALYEDSERRLWISSAGKIFRLDTGGWVSLPASTDGSVHFTERHGTMLVASATSRLTVLGLNGDKQLEPLLSLPFAGGNARDAWGRASWRDLAFPALLDRQGNLWVGTNGDGLLRIDVAQRRVSARYTERDGLSGNMVRAIVEDRDGNIWVGTHSGLTRVTPAGIHPVAVSPGATAEDVSTVAADASGAVWVEAAGALVRLVNDTRTVFYQEAGARFDRITAMHMDAKGVLWVATREGGVVRYIRGHFERVGLPNDIGGLVVTAISSDLTGTIWLYGGRRLLAMHPDTHNSSVFSPPSAMVDTTIRFIFADSRGRVWLAADGARLGVYEQGAFRLLTDAQGVPPGNPTGIHEDKSGRIWISSDSGLSTIQNDRVITFAAANGVPRNRAFFVIGDDEDRLWVGTGSGLLCIERKELDKAIAEPTYHMALRLYDVSDGLRGTPVVRGYPTAVRTRDRIWFVTSTGVAVADPRQLRDTLAPPVPRIEQVLIDGEPIDATDQVRLPSDVASLQIEYAALMLTAPTKVRFRHRLDGVDADWVNDGDTRRTVYAHLRSGTYRFNVAASGGDERWTDHVAAWTFVLPPKWYQTRLFYGAAAASLAVTLWGSWQVRLRQVKRRFTDVLGERARVGREIHDTLLQSLVGMGLQLDTAAKLDDPDALKDELQHIRGQVQHYIGEAQQSIWDLRSTRLDSGDLAARLRERAERLLQPAGIGFDFTVVGPPRPVSAYVDQQILRIGMEAVVNAVRHAQASHIRMALLYEGASVRLRVTDDGHGFNPDTVHGHGESHWGLAIMRERAEQMGGRFSVDSGPDRGTSIELVAPCVALT